jgi:predicted ATPase/DNA-binding SARP family transcriptional activator
MRLRVLGPLSVDGASKGDIERPSHRRLLAILALDPGVPLTTDTLIDRFWPRDPPPTAKASIHTHVSAVRRLLGSNVIVTDGDSYRLNTDEVQIDSLEFVRLVASASAAATRGEWPDALSKCEGALELSRGRPFADLQDEEYARPTVVGLDEARLELLETRAASLLELGRPTDALVELEGLVIEHPFRERLWECLMLARYRVGRYTEALRAYRELTARLAEVGLEPGDRVRRLEQRILLRDESLTATRHNLPTPLNEFVGRADELDAARDLIRARRLVTFTGPAGSGKTRLVTEVASSVLDEFPHGVWFVELAAISDPAFIPTEIARAMNLTPKGADAVEMILGALAGGRTLMVLDNCEHLLEGCARTAERLLSRTDQLVILATSREPLRIGGESLFDVNGLNLPDPGSGEVEVGRSDAIRLLERRSRLVDPSFRIDRTNLAAAVNICRSLDGMPLALELVAARTRTMTLQAIEDRLDDHLALLTTGHTTAAPRHRTLQSAIEWSCQLLTPTERTALNRLGVFQGGFELEAAEQVISGRGLPASSIANVVADLVDKSLITTYRTRFGLRYRLLETVRQYALGRLHAAGDVEETHDRHSEWCLALVDDLWQQALGPRQAHLIRTLETEGDNIQAALTWNLSREVSGHVCRVLRCALGWRWYFEGHLDNATSVLRAALETADDGQDRALIHALTACCLYYSEDIDDAAHHAARGHELAWQINSDLARAWVITTVQLGHLMSAEADPATMLPLAAEAAEIVASSDDAYARMLAEQAMADAYCWNGDTTEGHRHQRAAIDLARTTADGLAIDRIYGASIYNFMLDPATRPTEPFRITQDWRSRVPLGDDSWRSTATDWLPWVYLQVGDFERADEAADRIGTRTLDGYNLTIYLIVRATIAWMRGNVKAARTTVGRLDAQGVNTRWPHVYYPLVAEIAADQGRLDDLRLIADRHLALQVHTSAEATKLGTLGPLVRAIVDAALESGSREDARQAETVVSKMHRILDEHPPPLDSWTSIMTHRQNLAFAEAELTRLGEPNPTSWWRATEIADYAYYELYARWRCTESKLALGETAAVADLQQIHSAVASLGMQLLVTRAQRTALEFGVTLDRRRRPANP